MNSGECLWNIYDDESRDLLGIGLYISGICSLMLTGWLLIAFVISPITCERSYWTLLNLCVASLARSLLAGFIFSGISALAHRWLFGETSCKLFGFIQQFILTYQIEALTHMCIERYVVAKYFKYGWEMKRTHYALFIGLCWMFSLLYSLPSLFGVGRYGWDYSCTTCTLDLILESNSWTQIITVSILFLISVKPLLVIIIMLMWARQIEKQCYNEGEHQNQIDITKSTGTITWVAILCWTPGAIAAAWSIIPQLMYGVLIPPPLFLVLVAALCSEVAPGAIALAAFWSNDGVRSLMISMLGEQIHIKNS